MNLRRTIVVAGCCAGLAGACGGGGGGSSVDTGLSETRLLSDVTPEEATNACEAIERSFTTRLSPETIVRAVCEMFGAVFTQNAADCRTMADTCVQDAENGDGDISLDELRQDFDCETESVGDDLEGCSATVGDLEACFEDTISLMESTLTRFSCQDAGTLTQADREAMEGFGDLEPPASCQVLSEQCPSFDL
jgi:hypothetical protein